MDEEEISRLYTEPENLGKRIYSVTVCFLMVKSTTRESLDLSSFPYLSMDEEEISRLDTEAGNPRKRTYSVTICFLVVRNTI